MEEITILEFFKKNSLLFSKRILISFCRYADTGSRPISYLLEEMTAQEFFNYYSMGKGSYSNLLIGLCLSGIKDVLDRPIAKFDHFTKAFSEEEYKEIIETVKRFSKPS